MAIQDRRISSGGLNRRYMLYWPETAGRWRNDLVIVWHGGEGGPENIAIQSLFPAAATQRGFVVVAPDAGGRKWNDGRSETDDGIDDVQFAADIIDELDREGIIDRERVFSAGMSNGGMMTLRIASDRPELFQGYAAVSANMPEDHEADAIAAEFTRLMMFSGTADLLMPYNGGTIPTSGDIGSGGTVISAPDTRGIWTDKIGDPTPVTTTINTKADGTSVTKGIYTDPTNPSREVVFYRIIGGGHNWPGTFSGSALNGLTTYEVNATGEIINYYGITSPSGKGAYVEQEIDRVLTQYRESPVLLGLLRIYLDQIEQALLVARGIPEYFDLDTAMGDQLTLLGKRLGFPRCHCVCTLPPVFGFDCGGSYTGPYEIVGLCEGGSWLACRETGTSTVCIDDDEMYRAFLRARRYQTLGLYDADSLQAAAEHIWGDTVQIHNLGGGRVVVSPGRALSADETVMRQIAFRVLPIAPGIQALTSDATGPIFGFGDGWYGFCDDAVWLCPADPHPYDCA